MKINWKNIVLALSGLVVIVAIVLLVGSFFGKPAGVPQGGGAFGTSSAVGVAAPLGGAGGGVSLPSFATGTSTYAGPPIFKIADGPIVAATLIEGGAPTTTSARYITSLDGHVIDLPLDVPGAAPRTVSNTTIPGVLHASFTEAGSGVIVQYLQSGTIKSAHLSLPIAGTTTPATGVTVRFLPDNIIALAVSPSGTSIAYALSAGSVGLTLYTAAADGSSAKALATTPLSHIQLAWPSKTTLVFYTNSASGVGGVVFSLNATTGAITPLLSGAGITASVDPSFSSLIHRIDSGTRSTLFTEDLKTGSVAYSAPAASSLGALIPETCVWSTASTTHAYCTAPSSAAPANYLDLWHSGEASFPSALVSLDGSTGLSLPLATPGSRDGGEPSDMIDLALSQSGQYLSFIAKDDGSLWGVRLNKK